jgi:tetratricopeptide (TPR) repeat protein
MTKKFCLGFFLLCINWILSAQVSVDSLFQKLKNPVDDKERIDIYNKLSFKLILNNPDTALYFAKSANHMSKVIKYDEGIINSLNNLSGYFLTIGNFDSAKVYSNMAINLCKQNSNSPLLARTYVEKGNIFEYLTQADSANYYFAMAAQNLKDDTDNLTRAALLNCQANLFKSLTEYDKALDYYLKALEIFKKAGELDEGAIVMSNIGNIYLIIEKYESALEQFNEALVINTKLNNLAVMAMDYNNLGVTYKYLKNYEKSLECHLKSIDIYKQLDRKADLLKAYYNLASIYTSLNDYNKAFENYTLSLDMSKELGFDIGLLYNNYGMGCLYSDMNNYQKSDEHLKKALRLGEAFKLPENRISCLYELYLLNKKFNKHAEALAYLEVYNTVKDSIFTAEREKTVAELQTRFETQKKESEIAELKHQEEVHRLTLRLIIILVILLVSVVVILIIYYQKQKLLHRHKHTIQQQEIEKMQIVQTANRQELTSKALMLAKSEEIILQFKNEIEQVLPNTDTNTSFQLKDILQRVQWDENSKEQWKEFVDRFDELNNGFIGKLIEHYPNLSPSELRLCAMLRLQLSTKDIADLSNRSIRTVENTRTNIRKKLNLNPNENLTTYLIAI